MIKGRNLKTYSSSKQGAPRDEAIRRLTEQIELGRAIRDMNMFSMRDLESAQERRSEWLENNIELMTQLFNHPFLEEEYSMDISFNMDSAMTFSLKEKYFKDDINEQIGRLESLSERLKQNKAEERIEKNLTEEPVRQEPPKEIKPRGVQPKEESPPEKPPLEKLLKKEPSKEFRSKEKQLEGEPSKEAPHRKKLLEGEPPSTVILDQSQLRRSYILFIYGHDEAKKESVLKFIEKVGLQSLSLHEQPNGSRSIMERFGEFSNINFAIILVTPGEPTPPEDKLRERKSWVSQNVIFELGYLVGKLGLGRVCALYQEGMEIPLDYSDIVCVPMDSRGRWRLLVAKEIKQAGIEIDLNKAI
jgi:predicted nucleotide-binding protein